MLTALIAGAEGEKWFRLFDKVFAERNLLAAYQQVAQKKGAPGVDQVTVDEFGRQIPETLWQLSDALKSGTYRPQAIRRVHIPKPGTNETRPLGIPTVRDRIVQAAVVNVIEPIFEKDFAEHSYGFRPGRGCKDALRRVDQLLKAGYVHVVDADLKGYFDSIPHDRLMERLQTKIADGRVLSLIEAFLKAGIVEDAATWTPESGAQGGPESAAQQRLSRSAGSPGGPSGLRDGALRRRFRDPVPHGGRRRACAGSRPAVDGRPRPDAASDENADRRRALREL
jgi:RNA-directed DNA polymerase